MCRIPEVGPTVPHARSKRMPRRARASCRLSTLGSSRLAARTAAGRAASSCRRWRFWPATCGCRLTQSCRHRAAEAHRRGIQGVMLNALGGFTDGGETLALVEALNGTSRWSPASPMLTARRYFCAVVFRCPDIVGRAEECLFAIGGGPKDLETPEYDARALRSHRLSLFDSSCAAFALIRFLRSVEVFDGELWREDAPLTTPRMQHGAAVHGDRIYVAGGFSSLGGDALTSVESFDGTRWERAAHGVRDAGGSAPRGQVALASFGGRLLFAGAIDEATAVVDALTLDDAGLSCAWTRAPSLRVPRMNARLAVFDDRLFAVGGSNPPGNDTWLDETEGTSASRRTPARRGSGSQGRLWRSGARSKRSQSIPQSRPCVVARRRRPRLDSSPAFSAQSQSHALAALLGATDGDTRSAARGGSPCCATMAAHTPLGLRRGRRLAASAAIWGPNKLRVGRTGQMSRSTHRRLGPARAADIKWGVCAHSIPRARYVHVEQRTWMHV